MILQDILKRGNQNCACECVCVYHRFAVLSAMHVYRLKHRANYYEALEALMPHVRALAEMIVPFYAICTYYVRHINDRRFGLDSVEQSAKHRILFVRICAYTVGSPG